MKLSVLVAVVILFSFYIFVKVSAEENPYKKNLINELTKVEERAKLINDSYKKTEIKKILMEINNEKSIGNFKDIKYKNLLEKIYYLNAEIERNDSKSKKEIQIEFKEFWRLDDLAKHMIKNETKHLLMIKNDKRYIAISLLNKGNKTKKIEIRVPDKNNIKISLKKTETIYTKNVEQRKTMLSSIEKNNTNYIELFPGKKEEIVFEITTNGKIAEGRYIEEVKISDREKKQEENISIEVQIVGIEVDKKIDFYIGGWEYLKTFNREDEIYKKLVDFYKKSLNVSWTYWYDFGKYNDEGLMIEEPNKEEIKKWIQSVEYAKKYYIFLYLDRKQGDFCNLSFKSEAFKKAVKNWSKWLSEYLNEIGVDEKKVVLLLVDEPMDKKRDEIMVEYASIIKENAKNIRVWEDPRWANPEKANENLFILSDEIGINTNCFNWEEKARENYLNYFFKKQKEGKEIYLYLTGGGSSSNQDPQKFYRYAFWYAYKNKMKGVFFWSYAYKEKLNNSVEWEQDEDKYNTFYLDQNNEIIETKQYKGIEQGILDLKILCTIDKEIDILRKMGYDKVDELIKSKEQIVNQIISLEKNKNYNWKANDYDYYIFDQNRERLIKLLEIILKEKNK